MAFVNFTLGNTVYPFNQFDFQFNRPDKVYPILGLTDTTLVNSYYRAWQKRVNKLKVDTTNSFTEKLSVPKSDLLNRSSISYEQISNTLALRIWGIDSTFKLVCFNIWVNEVPVFGQRGANVLDLNRKQIDTTITITLSVGENKIETSVLNVNGIESYRVPLYVRYTPKETPKEKLYFVGIGINKFKEAEHNLQYSVKDIHDLAKQFSEKYKGNIEIDTLFDENVTKEKIQAIKKHLQQSSVDDKVIIAYSGHGLLSKDYDYYLSTHEVNFTNPEINGLPYDELEYLLDSIPARKKLMLIDACHSGELDKDEIASLNKVVDSLNHQPTAMNGETGKGCYIVNTNANKTIGLKNSFELMQELFANVGRGTGATVLSAAAGTQFAIEANKEQNGYFTYSILELLKKNAKTKISELSNYVTKRVEELSKGLQKPTSRKENAENDWEL